jgi:hypothetical protein
LKSHFQVGHPHTLSHDPTWAAWMSWAHGHGVVMGEQLQHVVMAAPLKSFFDGANRRASFGSRRTSDIGAPSNERLLAY